MKLKLIAAMMSLAVDEYNLNEHEDSGADHEAKLFQNPGF